MGETSYLIVSRFPNLVLSGAVLKIYNRAEPVNLIQD